MQSVFGFVRKSRVFQPAFLFSSLLILTIWAVIGTQIARTLLNGESAAFSVPILVWSVGGTAMTALAMVVAVAGIEREAWLRRREGRMLEHARAARRYQRLLVRAIATLPQGIAVTDAERRMVICNPPMAELPATVRTAHQRACPDDMTGLVITPAVLNRPDGTVLELATVSLPGGGALQTATDVTELRRASRRLVEIANYDQITRLANWGRFREALELIVANDPPVAFGVLVFDIDSFKALNEQHGTMTGDRVLRVVADHLRRSVRGSDLVARTGPDEFSVALVGLSSPAVLEARAVQLIDAIRANFADRPEGLNVTVSAGAVVVAGEGARVETILRAVGAALADARSAGGNCYRLAPRIGVNTFVDSPNADPKPRHPHAFVQGKARSASRVVIYPPQR